MDVQCSLLERFAKITDPRSRLGRRHPLSAILGLVTVSMLCGAQSLEAIAQFARDRGAAFNELLGLDPKKKSPCKATFSNVLRIIDFRQVEQVLAEWLQTRVDSTQSNVVALDGKTLRGTACNSLPGLHLLAAYAPDSQFVLAQFPVDAKTNEHKAALEMLNILSAKNRIVTADAMFTHRDFAEKVTSSGGDYVLPVKENQPELRSDIVLAFQTPEALSPSAATSS